MGTNGDVEVSIKSVLALVNMIKLCVLGDSDSGKTTVVQRFLHGSKELDSCSATVGVEMSVFSSENSSPVYIWDIGGSFPLVSCVKEYLSGSHGAVVVYDVNRLESQHLSAVASYVDLLKGFSRHLPVIVLGNKCDTLTVTPTKPSFALNEYLHKRGIRHEFTSSKNWESSCDAFNAVLLHVRKHDSSPLVITGARNLDVRGEDTSTNSYCSKCGV